MTPPPPPPPTAAELAPVISDTAKSVTTTAVTFVATLAYLAISMSSTDDSQLLVNGSLNFPIQNSGVTCQWFYALAPLVIVLFHLYLLTQEYFLAEKLATWSKQGYGTREIPTLYPSLSVVRALSLGSNRVVRGLNMCLFYLVQVLLPVGLLLILKMRFLRYHDLRVTNLQECALVVDLALIFFFFVFTNVGQTGRRRWVYWFRTLALFSAVLFTAGFGRDVEFHGDCGADFDAPAPHAGLSWIRYRFARPYLDLKGKNLKDLDLSLRDLRCADFRRATLEGVDFRGGRLNGARFDWATLKNVNFSPRFLIAQQVETVRGDKQSSDSVELFAKDLTDLSLANFNHATGDNDDFSFARLREVDFRHAVIPGANFTRADLDHADLSWVKGLGAVFAFADLTGATFRSAHLELASFRAAHLRGGHFVDAHLDGADFAGAELAGGDYRVASLRSVVKPFFHEVILRGAKLGGIDLCPERRPGALRDPPVKLVDLREVDWSPMPRDGWTALEADLDKVHDPGLHLAIKNRLDDLLKEVSVGPGARDNAVSCLTQPASPEMPKCSLAPTLLAFSTATAPELGGCPLPRFSQDAERDFFRTLVRTLDRDSTYPIEELRIGIRPPPPINPAFANALACQLQRDAKVDPSISASLRYEIRQAIQDADCE